MHCITDNKINAKAFIISGEGLIPPVAALRGVRFDYAKDEAGARTSVVTSVRYDCVDMETLGSFSIKIPTASPIITPDELEKAPSLVFLEIPVEEVQIKPFEIAFGVAKVSITAPYVKLYERGN